MTENPEHLAARIGKAILRWAALAAGLVLSVRASGWTGFGAELRYVTIWHVYDSYPALAPPWSWDEMALCVVSIVLLTGASRWRVGRVNIGQIIGAVWMGLWTLFFTLLIYAVQFPGGDDLKPCVRPNCWPAGVAEPLAASPLLIACVAMIIVAFFAERLNWVARALIPAAVYLAARIVQVLIWVPVVIPFLAGP